MAGDLSLVLTDLRDRLSYFDRVFGPDGDCGDSCIFVSVNDLRVLLRALPDLTERAAA